jgi:hypothetical protein
MYYASRLNRSVIFVLRDFRIRAGSIARSRHARQGQGRPVRVDIVGL